MLKDLLQALNESGIPFVRDAWVDAPAGDYGVVETLGEPSSLWGDDRQIMQLINCNVYLYNRNGQDDNAIRINSILNNADVYFNLVNREYLYDVNMIRYTWHVTL